MGGSNDGVVGLSAGTVDGFDDGVPGGVRPSPAVIEVQTEHASHADDRRRAAGLLGGLAVLIALAIVVGSQLSGPTSADGNISAWFLDHRTQRLDSVTAFFSDMASTPVIIGIGLLVVAVCLARRAYDASSLIVVAMAGEIVMFLSVTFVVERPRPDIVRLDAAPPTSSFPSGHTLAAFVLWTAIAVIAARRATARPVVLWTTRILAMLMPVAVGLSRVYRGMHHPTDVIASSVLGAAWMTAVVLLFSRPIRWIPVIRPDLSIGRNTR